MPPLRVGVIGCGYWGPNLIRNFFAHPDATVSAAADRDEERRRLIHGQYPVVQTVDDGFTLIARPDVDAVAIVTPIETHYPLAKAALEAGKHVLVEKPLSNTSEQCKELIELASARKLALMVDHTFVFTGAVRKIREIVSAGGLGRVLYFDSVRINLGLFSRSHNVLWDLAPHDLSILDYVLDRKPRWVSAVGACHYGEVESLAYLTLGFDDDTLAHIHCNWMSPVKVRTMLIGGTERMLVYDDTEPSEKVKIYDHGITLSTLDREGAYQMLVQYRTGDVVSPKLDTTEALKRVVDDFVGMCLRRESSVSDGAAGARVVRLLEAAQESLRREGARVRI